MSKFGMAIRHLAMDRFQGETGDDHLTQILADIERRGESPQPLDASRQVNSAVNAWRNPTLGNLLSLGSSHDRVGWGYDT